MLSPHKRAFLPHVFIITLFILFSVEHALAGQWGFEFDREADLGAWRTSSVVSARVTGGTLLLNGRAPQLYSPEGLNIPSEASLLSIRVKGTGTGFGVLGVRTSAGTGFSNKMLVLKDSPGFRVLDLYIGDLIRAGGPPLHAFTLRLPGSSEGVSIDSIRFREPTGAELAGLWWRGFWDLGLLGVRLLAVNFIEAPYIGPLSFLTLIYDLMAVIAAAVVLGFVIRKAPLTKRRVGIAALAAFIAGGALLTARMDYNWLAVWHEDLGSPAKDLPGRTAALYSFFEDDFADFREFIDFVKDRLPPGATVRPAVKKEDEPLAGIARYFLLPVYSSRNARYVWVYGDGVSFDAATGTLKKGGRVVALPVRLHARYSEEAAVYELVKGGPG